MDANQCRLFIKKVDGFSWRIFSVMRDTQTGVEGSMSCWDDNVYSMRWIATNEIYRILKRDGIWLTGIKHFYDQTNLVDETQDMIIDINMLQCTGFGHTLFNFAVYPDFTAMVHFQDAMGCPYDLRATEEQEKDEAPIDLISILPRN